MSYKQQLEKMGVTPSKLALVVVLSVVLVAVIVMQLPDESTTPSVVSDRSSSSQKKLKPVKPEVATESSTKQMRTDLPSWPKVTLAQALVADPFKAPDWAVPVKAERPEGEGDLAELQEQGVSIVVITSDFKSARIGDQKVQVGDVLEGYRITDITADGILLDKIKSQ